MMSTKAKRVTILVSHAPGERGKQPYLRILGALKENGASRAAAFRAVAAFDARPRVQTAHLAEVVPDLPYLIMWVDTEERVHRILPHIRDLIGEGMITIEDAEIVLYRSSAVPPLPSAVTVGDVMTRDALVVHPNTPVRDIVAALTPRRFRAVPVVDENDVVIGIITNSDLVRRGGLPVRLSLLQSMEPSTLNEHLTSLNETRQAARDIMTSPVVTVPADCSVPKAAALMRAHKLKRLPVVDSSGKLIGIVSRLDLLRTIAAPGPSPDEPPPGSMHAALNTPIGSVMTGAVPAIGADAPLTEVLTVIASTRLHRAVVVDQDRHVLGIITGAELLNHVAPEHRPDLVSRLMQRVPFAHTDHRDEGATPYTAGTRAQDVMGTNIITVHEDEPISDVLAAMLAGNRKIIPVVDRDDRLTGMVDRADLLDVLANQ